MKRIRYLLLLLSIFLSVFAGPLSAAPFKKLEKPPLTENWFGIYVDNERVGFSRQKISETADGYRLEGDGSVRINLMGFSREASTRETYQVAKNLTLRSFDVELTINGVSSRVSGTAGDGTIRVKSESNGKVSEKRIKFKGELYPAAALNIVPLMRDATPGKSSLVSNPLMWKRSGSKMSRSSSWAREKPRTAARPSN